jgi:hypothetical protein
MKFRLQKSTGSNHAATKFDVVDSAGTICGRITVPPEEAADLERHWLGGATQPKAAAAAALATSARGEPQNPMVAAMVRAARKNRPTKQAILRGC